MRLRCMELDGNNFSIVDTDLAKAKWEGARDFNGRHWIHRSTGEVFRWETLYLSRKNRYYIVTDSTWPAEDVPKARFVTPQDAAKWLLLNDYQLPEDLKEMADEIE